MAFDWAQYIEVAKILTDVSFTPCNEGKYRAAMSRSYYAAYCLTYSFLSTVENVAFDDYDIHS